MSLAHSKITSQGQISVPVEVRRRLGVGPGSVLEWNCEGDRIVVQRSARYGSGDIHDALFPESPPAPRALDEMKKGIAQRTRERHARR